MRGATSWSIAGRLSDLIYGISQMTVAYVVVIRKMFLNGSYGIMPAMETRERDNLAKYIVAFPKKRKLRDVRDYILPAKGKKKRRINEIDKVVYGL